MTFKCSNSRVDTLVSFSRRFLDTRPDHVKRPAESRCTQPLGICAVGLTFRNVVLLTRAHHCRAPGTRGFGSSCGDAVGTPDEGARGMLTHVPLSRDIW